jgi:hypothetical protein
VATDGGILVWDLDAAHWSDAACQIAGRSTLTVDEWQTYLGDLADYGPLCPDAP